MYIDHSIRFTSLDELYINDAYDLCNFHFEAISSIVRFTIHSDFYYFPFHLAYHYQHWVGFIAVAHFMSWLEFVFFGCAIYSASLMSSCESNDMAIVMCPPLETPEFSYLSYDSSISNDSENFKSLAKCKTVFVVVLSCPDIVI